jgi:histidyl-tRNA synthetase
MGPEILGQMYVFPDKKGRNLCLRPEGTATCQLMARGPWIQRRDVKIWYEARCWRYERPQAGRYREFTQIGVEILNPRVDAMMELVELAKNMVGSAVATYEIDERAKRGLAYYVAEGFEIRCPILGAQKQVCGGGRYAEGAGFAIGLDRLVLAKTLETKNGP